MLISIIIPTYNRRNLLSLSIDSVVNQTNGSWELIIVDDGSEDKTDEEVKKYLEDDRIKYFYQTHQGVSVARNRGVEEANGSFIIFLDSDDTLYPELISTLSCLEIKQYDLICWEIVKNTNGKEELWKPRKMGSLYNNIVVSFLAGSVCYKKSLIEKAGGYDPKMSFGENYELGLRISREKNLKIKLIHKPLSTYHIDKESRSSNSYENRMISGIHQYEKHKKIYDQHPKAKAEMTYIIGFIFYKSGNKKKAMEYFKTSWSSNPLNYKALLRIMFLSVSK